MSAHTHDHDHDHDVPEVTALRCADGACALPREVTAPLPADAGATRIHVAGLCCDSEVAMVDKRLGRVDGVREVRVNLVARQVSVWHGPEVAPERLLEALNEVGLGASLVRKAVAPPDTRPSAALVGSGLLFAASLASPWLPPLAWAAFAAVVAGGLPIARRAVGAVRTGLLDMNVLMTIAVIGALAIGEWVEGAAVVFLFTLSEYLESRSLDTARSAIGQVVSLVPDAAVLGDGRTIPVEDVPLGATVTVKPGARVPLDGRVTHGRSTVDESALTGESLPVAKGPGDEVSAGTVNHAGLLTVETTSVAADSTAARLVRLVEEAQTNRSPSERFVDRFARIYTPTVVVVAALLAVVPPLLGGDLREWVYRALVLLVVACPCALVISTPVAVVSGLARAARRGILIKGGAHLEALGRLDAIALDKTGTLTQGRFEVVDCLALNGFTAERVHAAASAAESGSSHPLASALVHHTGPAGSAPTFFEIIEGEGIEAQVGDERVHVGNHRLAERLGWHDPEEHERFEAWMSEGRTVVYVGIDGRLAGLHTLRDAPRPEARAAVLALRAAGLHVVMLTGDNAGTAEAIRQQVGLDEARAELLPGDKVAAVRELRRTGSVGMVGDGINDAPALAEADVGIAMGARGTALAVESADVALMSDDLSQLAEAVGLGRRALRVIRRNIAFSIAVKAAVLLVAALGFATLWMAVLADVGATLLVVVHSLTLLRAEPPPVATAV